MDADDTCDLDASDAVTLAVRGREARQQEVMTGSEPDEHEIKNFDFDFTCIISDSMVVFVTVNNATIVTRGLWRSPVQNEYFRQSPALSTES